MKTRPCPYCGHKLTLRKGDYWCGRFDKRFRFDGRQFRRVRA